MQALHIAEVAPVLLGGRRQSAAVGHAQNTNAVQVGERCFVYVKILRELPETAFPPSIHLRVVETNALREARALSELFEGANAIVSGEPPIIDFGIGVWSAPLDSYVNPAVRWTDEDQRPARRLVPGESYQIAITGTTDFTALGAQSNAVGTYFTATGRGRGNGTVFDGICPADRLRTGVIYEIRSAGTTDFTACGAPSNVVGTKFRATGPGQGSGHVFRTKGARHGDIATCSVTEDGTRYIQHYVNVYDYDNRNNNRLALLESTDGRVFSEVGEIRFGGGPFGSTVADVIQVGATLYMVCGEEAGSGRGYRKALRYSEDRGRSWSEIGTIVELLDDPASCRHSGLPVGRILIDDIFVYLSAPAARIAPDWPEANLIFRRAKTALRQPGLWEEWPGGVSVLRGPQYGGIWNIDYLPRNTGDWFGLTNEFGAVDFDAVNTAAMNTLREAPYYLQDVFAFKHTGLVRSANRLALTDWSYWPWKDGDMIRLECEGLWLTADAREGGSAVLVEDPTARGARWQIRREAEFWVLAPAAASDLSLAPGRSDSASDRHEIGAPLRVRRRGVAAVDNLDHHWQAVLLGDDRPRLCTLVNRTSSLALSSDCSQWPALSGREDQIWRVHAA